jgi:hypothetical protein
MRMRGQRVEIPGAGEIERKSEHREEKKGEVKEEEEKEEEEKKEEEEEEEEEEVKEGPKMNHRKGKGKRREEHVYLQVILDRSGDFPGHADKHKVTIPACRAKPSMHVSVWKHHHHHHHHHLLSPPPPSQQDPTFVVALGGCYLRRKIRRGSGGGKAGNRTLDRAATEASTTACGTLIPAFSSTDESGGGDRGRNVWITGQSKRKLQPSPTRVGSP